MSCSTESPGNVWSSLESEISTYLTGQSGKSADELAADLVSLMSERLKDYDVCPEQAIDWRCGYVVESADPVGELGKPRQHYIGLVYEDDDSSCVVAGDEVEVKIRKKDKVLENTL